MDIIPRLIQQQIEKCLFQGKAIIIYGARQVGKTTLIRQIQKKYPDRSLYLNCDQSDIQNDLANPTSTELKDYFGSKTLIFLDEAQALENTGITIKLIVDNFPQIQVVATGSSAFELSNKIIEPLTGRHFPFQLFPFSLEELNQVYDRREIDRLLQKRIIYGLYPEVVQKPDQAPSTLKNVTESYLYKDILNFRQIRKPEVLTKLLEALAYQIGQEVSYNELASLTGLRKETVDSYLQILEQAFIIYRLRPYSSNLRTELRKLRKIYFIDTGIRDALINNLNLSRLRPDMGVLWENFLLTERLKFISNHQYWVNRYFWRTYRQRELDYLEEANGKLRAFEIKLNNRKKKKYHPFQKAYPAAEFQTITPENYYDFVTKK